MEKLILIIVLKIRLHKHWRSPTMIYLCGRFSFIFVWIKNAFFSFQIIGTLTAKYYNFHLETCISFTIILFKNKQIYKHLFDYVTCGIENPELRYTINRDFYKRSIHLCCYNTSEVHSVTRSTDVKMEFVCGIFIF